MTTAQNLPVPAKPPLKAAGGGVQSIVPQDAEQAFRMAQMIHASGMAPRDMQTPEKIVTSIIAGMEIGLKPFQSVQSFAVVNGRPTIWGDAALGLVQASGYLEDFEETVAGDGEEMVATCFAKRSDRKSPIVRTFSVGDAKAAGLWKKQGPWTQYPKRMLQLRARAFAIRDGFPDVLKGIGIQEEVADYSGPSTERQPDAPAVTGAALIAQASEAPQIAPPPAAEQVTALLLPDLPPEDGDRNGWLKDVKALIAGADANQIATLGLPVDLPGVLQSEINRAVKRRSGELAQAAA